MICKIQVVTVGEDGREETREIACLESVPRARGGKVP
jgi:hypothetical protein